jgi:hypothetical protein
MFPESLDPLSILAKNIRYPLPWIVNPCESMKIRENEKLQKYQ